jgi:ADP-dependent NAD(P)H-hydrate dehydratase / NAD(P)H-hydrate epimerase
MFAHMAFTCKIAADGSIERPALSPPSQYAHKYTRGHALVFSGPALHTGAARLSGQAALGVGTGLVTLVGDERALAEHAAHVTAIMLRPIDPLLAVIDDRVSAFAIGPAAGVNADTRHLVGSLLARGLPMVIDADGLTSFADQPESLFAALHQQAVLTPHEGEFRAIFPDLDLRQRHHAVGKAATRCGATVLLKGPQTLIAAPDGRLAINHHASPWLATAGSGDVLTGLVCGLLAQGVEDFEAACMAAWLHGDIGLRGGAGLTADRMMDMIPLVLAGCLAEAEDKI